MKQNARTAVIAIFGAAIHLCNHLLKHWTAGVNRWGRKAEDQQSERPEMQVHLRLLLFLGVLLKPFATSIY